MYQIRDSPKEAFFNAARMLILLSYIYTYNISHDLIQFGLLDSEAPTWFQIVTKTRASLVETLGFLVRRGFLNDTEKSPGATPCTTSPMHSVENILNSSERNYSLKMLGYVFDDQCIPPEEILLPLDLLVGLLHGQLRFEEAHKLLDASFAAPPAPTLSQPARPEPCVLWSSYAWTVAKCGEPEKAVVSQRKL